MYKLLRLLLLLLAALGSASAYSSLDVVVLQPYLSGLHHLHRSVHDQDLLARRAEQQVQAQASQSAQAPNAFLANLRDDRIATAAAAAKKAVKPQL